VTTELVTAVFAGLVLLVGAISTAVIGFVKLRQAQEGISAEQKVMHKAVNSNMSAALKKISRLQDRLEGLPYVLDDGTDRPQTVRRKQPAAQVQNERRRAGKPGVRRRKGQRQDAPVPAPRPRARRLK
jgi:hypothetical protein